MCLDLSPQAKINQKRTKRDLIKPKTFCTAKETINKTKRWPTELEKMFANHMTSKGHIYLKMIHTTQYEKKTSLKNGQKT